MKKAYLVDFNICTRMVRGENETEEEMLKRAWDGMQNNEKYKEFLEDLEDLNSFYISKKEANGEGMEAKAFFKSLEEE